MPKDTRQRGKSRCVVARCAPGHPKSFTPIWTDGTADFVRATIIGQLKPAESVRVTWHPIIIRYPRGGSTTYPPDQGDSRARERRQREPGRVREMIALPGARGLPAEEPTRRDGIDYSDYVASDSTIPFLSTWPSRSLRAGSEHPPRRTPGTLGWSSSRRPVLFRVNQCGQHALSLTP